MLDPESHWVYRLYRSIVLMDQGEASRATLGLQIVQVNSIDGSGCWIQSHIRFTDCTGQQY